MLAVVRAIFFNIALCSLLSTDGSRVPVIDVRWPSHLLVLKRSVASAEVPFRLHLSSDDEPHCEGWVYRLYTTSREPSMEDAVQGAGSPASNAHDICRHCERSGDGAYACKMNAINLTQGHLWFGTYLEHEARASVSGGRLVVWHEMEVVYGAKLSLKLPAPDSHLVPSDQGEVELTVGYSAELGSSEHVVAFYSVEIWFGDARLEAARDTRENGWELTEQLLRGEIIDRHKIKARPGCYELRVVLSCTYALPDEDADETSHVEEMMREVCIEGEEPEGEGWEGSLSPKVKLFCQDMACKCELDDTCRDDDYECESPTFPDMLQYTEDAMINTNRYLRGDFSFDQVEHAFDMKVFVLSLPGKEQKRRHMEGLLKAAGFRNVSFPALTLKEEIDVEALISSGWVTREGVELMSITPWTMHGALKPYIARAMDNLRVLEEGLSSGAELIGVFEDDLMVHDDLPSLNLRIKRALEELPASADLLYLEYCFEKCSSHCSEPGLAHISRAHRPRCTGAIVFTAQGARKVLHLCKPVFAAVDNMLPMLIERGHLEAYLLRRPGFFQDAFWGSDVDRQTRFPHNPRQHAPIAPVCEEDWFRHSRFSSMYKFYVASVVGNMTSDNSYVDSVYGSVDAAVSTCMRQAEGDVVLLPRSSYHVFHSIPSCSLMVDQPQCLLSHVADLAPRVEVFCDDPVLDGRISGVCSVAESHERFMFSMCEDAEGTALILSPSNDCYRSRSCHFSLLSQDVEADYRARMSLHRELSIMVFDDLERERREVCYLLYGEALTGEHLEYLRTRLAADESGGRLKQGIVKLVYSRQLEGEGVAGWSDVMEAPAALSVSYLRWHLLESALRRFQYPMVEFGRFRFCHYDTLLSGACVEEEEGGREGRLGGRWASDRGTLTLRVGEVKEALSFLNGLG
ncbi:hypothetical protein GUITHDRAFT_142907 [Guillardia theta CCMP2712]|uniref:Uncharacterized protein n=2 Tax=Guillardia theta TaxID=55529 RepID=L1IV92_GUITC|nr:hypothetical protein GUITHDRAFT_142907 [Guillardia theta CCMP2712]EKX40181.1 hypothetical protein GUITHDRAFT_142907 [Guillardia theta CCMP2712]|eukprot:XP_005827161.1 hypothetical protein GUITHDRAFT_142907 [Guillardia theta CCMP2712]